MTRKVPDGNFFRSDEPIYEDEDANEFYEPEVQEDEDGERAEQGDDQDHVVISGDPSAAANALKSIDKASKDKKIPDTERMTTPYMTKYERARVLGTRALQLRFVCSQAGWKPSSRTVLTGLENTA